MILRITLLSLLVLSFNSVIGQKKKANNEPPELTKEQEEQDAKNHKCAYTGKFTSTQRQNQYPYNVAAKVLLVSFDTLLTGSKYHLPELNDEVHLPALKENVELSKSGIDSLTDIIFNLGYSGKIRIISSTGCYDPHNAILFVDADGKIFEFMEICFGCDKIRVSDERIKFGEPCDGKYEAIQDFFRSKGIKLVSSSYH